MNYIPFSTGNSLESVVNVSELSRVGPLMHKRGTDLDIFSTDASTAIFTRSTFLSNGMASDIHFFTRSTITTKKQYKFYFLADLEMPTKLQR